MISESVQSKWTGVAPVSHAKEADEPYLDVLADVNPQPIFIMGPHRSGTTLFYSLLAETGRFNFPSFYCVMHRDELLRHHFHPDEAANAWTDLQRVFDQRGIKSRVYDSLPAKPDLTEEYAYVLERQGRRPRLMPKNVQAFRQFMKKIVFIQNPALPLLLKNPYDAANFLFMQGAFPSAKYLFIHRNPVQVMDSQLRMLHLMLDPGNQLELVVNERLRRLFDRPLTLATVRRIYNEHSPVMFWQALYHLVKCDRYIANNIDALGSSAMNITYQELCSEPNLVIRRVLRFVGVPDVPDLTLEHQIRPRHRPLLPLVEKHQASIERQTRAFCERFAVASV